MGLALKGLTWTLSPTETPNNTKNIIGNLTEWDFEQKKLEKRKTKIRPNPFRQKDCYIISLDGTDPSVGPVEHQNKLEWKSLFKTEKLITDKLYME